MTENSRSITEVEIKIRLDRIERILISNRAKAIRPKKCWVKASWVKSVTGWTNEEMRRARNQGLIKWEHNSLDGIKYDINSVNPLLFKRPI